MKSLQSKILFYLILFAIIPLTIGSSVILYKIYQSKLNTIYNKHTQILNQIDQKINDRFKNIEFLGKFIQQEYYLRKDRILKGITVTQKDIDGVYVVDKNGYIKDLYTQKKSSIKKNDDISSTFKLWKLNDKNDSYFSNVYLDDKTKTPKLYYLTKINENNIVVLLLNIDFLNEYIKRFKSENDTRGMVRVTNQYGIVITHQDNQNYVKQKKDISKSDIFKNFISKQQFNKQIFFIGGNIKENVGVVDQNKKTRWFIIVKESFDYAVKNFKQMILFVVVFLIVLILLSVYISIKLSKSILKPLTIVEKDMDDIAHGRYTKQMNKTGYVELNKLIMNFLLMKDKIHKREEKLKTFNHTLEEIVYEKTKELKTLNETLEKEVSNEVSKNKQKEKLLFEQSKMASMGEMIGNIAHQWRQPLSTISTAASGLRIQKEHDILTDEIFYESVDQITHTTQHLSQTIDDFRNFFKSSKKMVDFSLQETFNKNLSLLDATFKSNHIKVILVNQTAIELYGYENEFIQGLLNILNNANDALSIQDKDLDKYIFIEFIENDENVIITIKDSGGGIEEDIINKIFEPYFTTKHQAQGTGIGLYMTRQIIVDHMGGDLKVSNTTYTYNEKSFTGAQFTITLPLAI